MDGECQEEVSGVVLLERCCCRWRLIVFTSQRTSASVQPSFMILRLRSMQYITTGHRRTPKFIYHDEAVDRSLSRLESIGIPRRRQESLGLVVSPSHGSMADSDCYRWTSILRIADLHRVVLSAAQQTIWPNNEEDSRDTRRT